MKINYMENIRTAYQYFIYNPDKTQVVLQVYILNPLAHFQQAILFWIVDGCRYICLKFIDD